MSAPSSFDVLIVGAGLSGIGMAHHLQRLAPRETYQLLEARERIGGTWDLFRYPGVRSDSDMHTLGYRFRPWTDARFIAGGEDIRRYIEETAAEAGIDRHISFGTRVVRADWSSADARWTVETDGGEALSARFLVMASGYYRYEAGHRPTWPGEADYEGRIVHPQDWPDDLDWAGKRIAVIGSGATAVTLVPALARTAAHVTMVQRTPSYVAARPSTDALAARIKRLLPAKAAARIIRAKNILVGMAFFQLARRRPARTKAALVKLVEKEIGAEQARHFAPSYDPWDQRLCLAPDGDLFAAIREGRASVTTGEIGRFVPGGIEMASGVSVAADIVVTATGLVMEVGGGVAVSVDGRPVRMADSMAYRGVMFSDLPNFASIFGYTNASWTLKADLSAAWICRVLNRMRRKRARTVVAPRDPAIAPRPFLSFTSGYVQRAADILPRQGDRGPWRLPQNFLYDMMSLRFGRLRDGVLEFRR